MTRAAAIELTGRLHDPQHQGYGGDGHRRNIEAREWYRQPARILARQPVAGEARNDTAADHHDQQHDGTDADAGAVFGRAPHVRLDVKCDVAGEQQRDQTHDPKISPILAGDNLARGGGDDQHQKADINDRRQAASRSQRKK